jgi:low affinity Fe/Cu permease
MKMKLTFSDFASSVAHIAGSPVVFAACVAIIVGWAVSGPFFEFSDTWQLIVNTGTTVVTFLMVFLIQNTQNRDNIAIQAKLDDLIRVTKAHKKLIGIEHLSEDKLERIRQIIEKENGKA